MGVLCACLFFFYTKTTALRYLHVEFYTGHCTGEHSFEVLSQEKRLRLHQFHCGDEICC